MANHRKTEAIDILCKIRGDRDIRDPDVLKEVELLDAVVEASYHKRNNYLNIALGGRYSGKLHLGRRAILGFALQQIQQWTGILVMVSWATKLFELASFDSYKASWMSGLLNTFGVIGTAAAALVIDRLGRRKSLQISFAIQGVSLFLVAALIKTSQDTVNSDPTKSRSLGTAGSAFTFTFVFFFCMFNIVPCWIYGTEIWPQEVRAKGYSFTILGWAIGCGTTTFVIPIMLANIGWWSFIFFGCMNIVVMPIIHFFFPETAGRSLEEVDLLFTSDSPLVSKNMAEYDRRVAEAGGNVAVAARRLLDEVDGESHLDPNRVSVVAVEDGHLKTRADMNYVETANEKNI
jgi:MFS family permease